MRSGIRRTVLTVASLDENSEENERVKHSPEDLASVVADEAEEPLRVDLGLRLGLDLLDLDVFSARHQRRVAIPRVEAGSFV